MLFTLHVYDIEESRTRLRDELADDVPQAGGPDVVLGEEGPADIRINLILYYIILY